MGLKYIFSPLDIDTITPIIKMARKVNPWMEHLKKFRAANKGMNNKLIFAAAKKTYKQSPKQIGGSADVPMVMAPAIVRTRLAAGGSGGGGDVSALSLAGAPVWAGGKKRSTKRRAKRSAKKRSTKRSTKRRGRGSKRSTKRSGGNLDGNCNGLHCYN